MTSNRLLAYVLGGLGAVLIFVIPAAWYYSWQFKPGLLFLTLGWMSLLVTGFFMVKAALAFDLKPAGDDALIVGFGQMQRMDLELEKRHLLKAIKEVEFERDMQKIDVADATDMIARYRVRALEILRLLDETGGAKYEAAIEREVARRLGEAVEPVPVAPPVAPPVAQPVAKAAPAPVTFEQQAAPVATTGLATRVPCAKCMILNEHDARFCKECGARMDLVGVN